MKVLYVSSLVETINAFLIPHINMLLDEGYEVECLCNINREIKDELKKRNIKFHNIGFKRNPLKINYFKVIKTIRELQQKNKYDVIHVHTPIAAFITRFALRRANVKMIYTAHGFHFFKVSSKINWITYYYMEKIASKWTDVIITINSEDYEIAKNKLYSKKIYLLNGVGLDLNKYTKLNIKERELKKKALGLNVDDFIIVMIADLNNNKNQIQLIKALEVMKDRCPKIKAIFVGEGDKLQELKEEARNRGVSDKVLFLGFRNDVNEIINISDIGVLLSYREGLPRNIMELMANGRKVIATFISIINF